jgi:hypothetical protein
MLASAVSPSCGGSGGHYSEDFEIGPGGLFSAVGRPPRPPKPFQEMLLLPRKAAAAFAPRVTRGCGPSGTSHETIMPG